MGVLDSIIGGVAGIAGNFINQVTGNDAKSQQNRLMKWQEEMLDKQFNYQSDQAKINRDFQREMYEDAKKYNSTSSKVKQAIDAGVNPYAALGGNAGSVSASTPSGSMVGTPSIPQPAQPNYVGSQSFNAVAAGLASLMQAAKTGVETTKVGKLLDKTVDKMSAEIDNTELRSAYQRLTNDITSKSALSLVGKAFMEYQNLQFEGLLTWEKINETKASASKLIAEAELTKEQKRKLTKYLDGFAEQMWNSEIAERQSRTTANYAEANESNARAALSDAQAAGQRLDNLIRNSTAVSEMRSNNHSYDVIIKTSQSQIDIYKGQALKLMAEGKFAEAQQVIGMMNQTINSVSNLISSIKPGVKLEDDTGGETIDYYYNREGKLDQVNKTYSRSKSRK